VDGPETVEESLYIGETVFWKRELRMEDLPVFAIPTTATVNVSFAVIFASAYNALKMPSTPKASSLTFSAGFSGAGACRDSYVGMKAEADRNKKVGCC